MRLTLPSIAPIRKAIIAPAAPLAPHDRASPSSGSFSPLLFPLVDRDGLCKPLLQIIAEDALESGITSIGVVVGPSVQTQCMALFESWRGPAGLPADWVRLQNEKRAAVITALHFIDAGDKLTGTGLQRCRDFVGDESFAFLPADVLYVSANKDRCLEQLLAIADRPFDCVLAVSPIMAREAFAAAVVAADGPELVAKINRIAHQPTLEQCQQLYTPGLPPGQYLAATGMSLLSPTMMDAPDQSGSLFKAGNAACDAGRALAKTLDAASFNRQTPYGLLEAQFALALAGIHRTEICEMIARTLARHAKI